MAKSVYEIWISQGKDKLQLPVLPQDIQISNTSSNDSFSISGLGELTIIQDSDAKSFTFESFFPKEYSSLCEYTKIPKPWDAIKKIEKWKASGKPIRFMITKTPINLLVSIEDFPHGEGTWDVGDLNYSLVLKEYKESTVRRVKRKKKPKKKPRPSNKPKPKVYKVKSGDTLWAIARREYGQGIKWKRIWSVSENKKKLIKRDKRNRKQPGHWIYPGQKIKIPR